MSNIQCNINKETNFSKSIDTKIQNNTDIKEVNYDLLCTYIKKFFVKNFCKKNKKVKLRLKINAYFTMFIYYINNKVNE